eukprot:283783-Rhodomonas_salina.1
MSGSDIAYAALCHVLHGTEIAYGAMGCAVVDTIIATEREDEGGEGQGEGEGEGAKREGEGGEGEGEGEGGEGAAVTLQRTRPTAVEVSRPSLCCYAVPGTEIAYAATRCP